MNKINKLLHQLVLQQPGITVYLSALFLIGLIVYCTYNLALSGVNITYKFCVIAIVGIMATIYILYLYKDFDD